VNRKDSDGDHIFGGGFLGLDNIGLFDRSKPLPLGGKLLQVHTSRCHTLILACVLCHVSPFYTHTQLHPPITQITNNTPTRAHHTPTQVDGTSWMAQFAVVMMKIALELAKTNKAYEDSACKYFEHYVQVCVAHLPAALGVEFAL